MPFTVTWTANAQGQLANLWVDARDRDAVTLATAQIDRELRLNPTARAQPAPNGGWTLTVPPLAVYFVVSTLDCIVEVAAVKRSDLATNGQP